MKTTNWVACAGLGLALVLGLTAIRPAHGADDDAALLRKQCSTLVDGWNKHDPKAMASVFAADGDAISPASRHAAGREAVEKMFAEDHTGKGPMRDSTLEVKDEPIRLVTADVAVSDAEVVVTGAYGPDGAKMGPLNVHVTNIWKKTAGAWSLFASRPYIKMPPPGAAAPK